MLTRFEAENWRCLKNFAVDLPSFGAFIGPNDSGKSTVLGAIHTLGQLAKPQLKPMPTLPTGTFRLEVAAGNGRLRLWRETTDQGAFLLVPGVGSAFANDISQLLGNQRSRAVLDEVAPVTLVRFDPDSLRGPSNLVPEGQLVSFLDRRGDGLAGVYYSILARGDDSFRAIAEDLRRLFPTVRGLRVPAVSPGQVTIEVELTDGTRVRPEDLSEGLLLYLAFAAIPHLQAATTVLIEEPETGLHPARIKEVLTLLRSFAEKTGTQVLMATHSPLVVNELEAQEVIVLTRTTAEGTRATVLKDTPRFEERSKIFALGELWLSYADGVQEESLLAGKSP